VNLAWKLAAVLRGRADATLLDTYEPVRGSDLLDAAPSRRRCMGTCTLGWQCLASEAIVGVARQVLCLTGGFGSAQVLADPGKRQSGVTAEERVVKRLGKFNRRLQLGLGGGRLPEQGKRPAAEPPGLPLELAHTVPADEVEQRPRHFEGGAGIASRQEDVGPHDECLSTAPHPHVAFVLAEGKAFLEVRAGLLQMAVHASTVREPGQRETLPARIGHFAPQRERSLKAPARLLKGPETAQLLALDVQYEWDPSLRAGGLERRQRLLEKCLCLDVVGALDLDPAEKGAAHSGQSPGLDRLGRLDTLLEEASRLPEVGEVHADNAEEDQVEDQALPIVDLPRQRRRLLEQARARRIAPLRRWI
jgi:hypothetical protein